MRNPYLDAAKAELEAAGIRDYELAHGSEHLQLRWSVTGITRVLWVPRTPSDWRSPRNTCRDVRALLRLDDLLVPPNSNGAPPRVRPAHCQWRQQVEALARRQRQVNIPMEHTAERDQIVAALRKLTTRGKP